MGRRKKDRTGERIEILFKLGLSVIALFSLAVGGVQGFPQTFIAVIECLLLLVLIGAPVAVVVVLLVRRLRYTRRTPDYTPLPTTAPGSLGAVRSIPETARPPEWTPGRLRTSLEEIDWYQFEKFCAALLQAEGFSVERKGGAQPDGGVDLIVEKAGERRLIQCKHWKTWLIKENVVRELLGSMTHFGTSQGAIYTIKGWTEPAARLASQHRIELADGANLVERAQKLLCPEELSIILDSRNRRCPKCESPMIWREGNFTPFWGCSRFPRCRGRLSQR